MTLATYYVATSGTGTVSGGSNALGAPNGVFTTDVDNVSWTQAFNMQNPLLAQANGTHTFTLRVRKETGTGTPQILTVRILENGVERIARTLNLGITSTTGQDVVVTCTEAEMRTITNLAGVEVEVAVQAVGGSGGARTTVQLDAITWTGDFSDASTPPPSPSDKFFQFL